MDPLVVTLLLDEVAQERFDALRRAHFPADRNHLQAHVTLFHALPGEHEERVRADLAQAARREAFDGTGRAGAVARSRRRVRPARPRSSPRCARSWPAAGPSC